LLWSIVQLAIVQLAIVQPLQLIDDRKSKAKESYRASAVIYVHLQVFKLGGSAQKTIRKLCQAVVVEPPGRSRKPNNSVRMCIPFTHKDQTGMRDLYIIHVHKIHKGPEHAGHHL